MEPLSTTELQSQLAALTASHVIQPALRRETHPAINYLLTLFQPEDRICIKLLPIEGNTEDFRSAEKVATEQYLSRLTAKNEAGFNVYVCMSALKADADRRIKENVGAIRTVYIDIDKDGQTNFDRVMASDLVPKPTFVLESSPGKFQVIWSIEEITVAEQEGLLRALISNFGGDPAVTDCTRILRLPGFVNVKYPEKPLVKIVYEGDGGSARLQDFHITESVEQKSSPSLVGDKIPRGSHDIECHRLAGKMRQIGMEEEAIYEGLVEFIEKRFENYGADYHEMARKHATNICKKPTGSGLTLTIGGKDPETGVQLIDAPNAATDDASIVAQQTNANITIPFSEDIFYGLAGRIIKKLQPETESHPVGNLLELLACFGNIVGPCAYYLVDGARHYTNIFVVKVGRTSKSRKGTGKARIENIAAQLDPIWYRDRNISGIGSGEIVVHEVRDAQDITVKDKKTGQYKFDKLPGIDDKRLYISEGEFAGVLTIAGRDGSTLSNIIRDAWDHKTIRNKAKSGSTTATDPHISISADITRSELDFQLRDSDKSNGFANRFLWCFVCRQGLKPFGGEDIDWSKEVLALYEAVAFARKQKRIFMDRNARLMWERVYEDLSKEVAGVPGDVTSRGEAQVIRLALIFALLDLSDHITVEHLKAAKALWQYCEDSARVIFGGVIREHEKIIGFLRTGPKIISEVRTQAFQSNRRIDEIRTDLNTLIALGRVYVKTEDNIERFHLIGN